MGRNRGKADTIAGTELLQLSSMCGVEYYDYEIIKDYDINNERRYTILTGGEEVEKLTIYPDKS